MSPEFFLITMLFFLFVILLSGFPIAFVLGGVSIIFAFLGSFLGIFDLTLLNAIPSRIYGIMTNELLLAVPFFIFMGITLEKAKISEDLLHNMNNLFGDKKFGLGVSVIVVGALLGASTGIVGATVVTMGLISLPVMMQANYDKKIASGVICASGTLGQIIPPSIVLLLLGDQISSAYQTAQMQVGNLTPEPVSVADLFMGAIIPSLILVFSYIFYLVIKSFISPNAMLQSNVQRKNISKKQIFLSLLPPLILIFFVLGSILLGLATVTEASSVGAVGALVVAFSKKRLNKKNLHEIVIETTKITSMIFTILIGATIFTLVFRGVGGDEIVQDLFNDLPGGKMGALLITMLIIFLLGFFLDFIEIIYVVIPIVAPILLMMDINPIWLAIIIAINLQTSFLTPPFGFALFYLRGVAAKTIKTMEIYKGVMPFILLQIFNIILLFIIPSLATYLPSKIYGSDYSKKNVQIEVEETYEVDF